MSVNEKMKAIADAIRDKTKGTEALTLNDMATEIPKVYEEGYNKATEESLANYIRIGDNQWSYATFPEGFEFKLEIKKQYVATLNGLLVNSTGVKKATIICDLEKAVNFSQLVRSCSVEVVDLTKCKLKPTLINYFALGNTVITSILGKLDLTDCTATTNAFNGATALENIEFVEDSINISISLGWCTKLTKASLTSIINGLNADVTGQTLTLSKTAVNNAFGINVDDASTYTEEWNNLRNSKSNWTISYA